MWEEEERIPMLCEEEEGDPESPRLYSATIDCARFSPGRWSAGYQRFRCRSYHTHWPLHQNNTNSPVYFGTVIAAEPPQTLLRD
jgi:hypothetical protein